MLPATWSHGVVALQDAQLVVLLGQDATGQARGPGAVAVGLGRCVLSQPLGHLQGLLDHLFLGGLGASGHVNGKALVGAEARAHLGEPRGVDADDVGGQDARPAVGIELDDGVARVDPSRAPSPPKWTGSAPSPPSQRYSSRGSQGRPAGGGVPRAGPHGSAQRPPAGLVNGHGGPSMPKTPEPLHSSGFGIRPPIRTIAITRPSAEPTAAALRPG